jgi:hypothetical protein
MSSGEQKMKTKLDALCTAENESRSAKHENGTVENEYERIIHENGTERTRHHKKHVRERKT